MGSKRHRCGTLKQVGVIIVCSIILTIFYCYLNLGPGRDTYLMAEEPYSYLYNNSYYLVEGARCKIPNLDPHHWSLRKIIERRSYASCRNSLPHLVLLRRSPNLTEVWLEIDKRAGKRYFRGEVSCCYQRVTRVHGSNDEIRKQEKVCFRSSTALSNSTQMVVVTCSKFLRTIKLRHTLLYENMFYIIVLTESVKDKMKRQEATEARRIKTKNEEKGKHDNKIDNSNAYASKIINRMNLNNFKLTDNQINLKENNIKLNNKKIKFKENKVTDKIDLKKGHHQEEDLSLLIIGIDSISRVNMIRTMPRTREFLEERGWFELEGYNKVGDNTLPNLLPLLTGRPQEDIEALYKPQEKGFDLCPMIWQDLAAKGYITSYAEDLADLSTFNCNEMKGFKEQPTDYYLRPLLKAGETMFKLKMIDDIGHYCVGSSMEAELLMDYTHQFVNLFHNYSYFNFVWMNAFSHEDVNGPSRMDKKIFQFFSDLNYTALRKTAVIFLSDHGIRFGPIRTSDSGWLEGNLPFIFFHLPDWYQEKYPEKIANLRANKNRLTCPYDVYETLNDLTGLSNRSACEKCSSLLRPIDLDRACSDIRISENWCTCTEMINLPQNDSRASDLGRLIVKHIHSLLSSHKDSVELGFRCANLTLAKVHSLQTNKNPIKSEKTSELFIVQVETAPSNALFEATVVMRAPVLQVTGDVSRLNKYREDGACVKDNVLRLFCYCEPVENVD